MDGLKLHLLINYYPAIGVIIGTVIFIGGVRFQSLGAQQFALKAIIFFALLTLVVVLTGEIASHPAEPYTDARAVVLASHKLTARIAFVLVEATGIAAVIALMRGRRKPETRSGVYTVFMILAVISSVLLVTTILKGRQVKWAFAAPDQRPTVLRSIDTETKLWHA
jgi:hypothetical protein